MRTKYEPRREKPGLLHMRKQRRSAFVFAIRIVQSLYYLNPKFQASSHLLWLYSLVCVGPGRKPRRPVFSERGSNILTSKRNASSKMLHNFANKYRACAKQGSFLFFVSISRNWIQKDTKDLVSAPILSNIVLGPHFFRIHPTPKLLICFAVKFRLNIEKSFYKLKNITQFNRNIH